MASIVPREWELSEALRIPATNEFFPWKIVYCWTVSLYILGTVQ